MNRDGVLDAIDALRAKQAWLDASLDALRVVAGTAAQHAGAASVRESFRGFRSAELNLFHAIHMYNQANNAGGDEPFVDGNVVYFPVYHDHKRLEGGVLIKGLHPIPPTSQQPGFAAIASDRLRAWIEAQPDEPGQRPTHIGPWFLNPMNPYGRQWRCALFFPDPSIASGYVTQDFFVHFGDDATTDNPNIQREGLE